MHRRGAEVTVVEHEDHLMPRQLDRDAAGLLRRRIEDLGVTVETGQRVAGIEGDGEAGSVEAVLFADGRRSAADTVIICAGVRANIDLPRMAGLTVGRGVLVDDRMRSSALDVYAVGECAEHRGAVYGLVGPGLEQADAAAAAIAGEPAPHYQGSTPATKLKVIGAEVFSIGDIEDLELRPNVVSRVWRDQENGLYRRLFLERGRLVGAVAVGDWPDASRVQAAALEKTALYPWMLWRFDAEGALWREAPGGAAALPNQAIVCNCTGVSAGRIRDCDDPRRLSRFDGSKKRDGRKLGLRLLRAQNRRASKRPAAAAPPKPVRLCPTAPIGYQASPPCLR